MNFPSLIWFYRKNNKLTIKEMANMLSINKNILRDWENGKTLPSLETLKELCSIAEIDYIEAMKAWTEQIKLDDQMELISVKLRKKKISENRESGKSRNRIK